MMGAQWLANVQTDDAGLKAVFGIEVIVGRIVHLVKAERRLDQSDEGRIGTVGLLRQQSRPQIGIAHARDLLLERQGRNRPVARIETKEMVVLVQAVQDTDRPGQELGVYP